MANRVQSAIRAARKYAEGGAPSTEAEDWLPGQEEPRRNIPKVNIHANPFHYDQVPEDGASPYKNQEVRAYQPTRREAWAQWAMGDNPSQTRRRIVEEGFGTSGIGEEGIGLIDATPFGWISSAEAEARKVPEEFKKGEYRKASEAARDAVINMLPGGKPASQVMGLIKKSALVNKMKNAPHATHEGVPFVSQTQKDKFVQPKVPPKTVETDDDGFLDVSQAEWLGDTLGTNPGGFANVNGQKYYLKHAYDPDHAKNEVLAGRIYALAGVPVADLSLTKAVNGKIGVASKAVDGHQLSKYKGEYAELPELYPNVVVDAWLRNWDSVGIGNENPLGNVMVVGGKAVRIDPGGALRYRGRGDLKDDPLGTPDAMPDLWHMVDPESRSGKVFGGVNYDTLREGAQRVADVDPAELAKLITKFGPEDTIEASKLLGRLLDRRDSIMKYFGVTPKGKQSEFGGIAKDVAPVKPSLFDQMENDLAEVVKKDVKPTPEPKISDRSWDDLVKTFDEKKPTAGKEPPTFSDADYAALDELEQLAASQNPKRLKDDLGPFNEGGEGNIENEPTIGSIVEKALGKHQEKTEKLKGFEKQNIGQLLGNSLSKAVIGGNLTKMQAKSAAKKLLPKGGESFELGWLEAAQNIWRIAKVSPHAGEAVFRALDDKSKTAVGGYMHGLKEADGYSPFDDLSKVKGKYLFSHTSDPKYWSGKPKKSSSKPKTAKDYTDEDIENYYKSQDEQADMELAIAQGLPVLPPSRPVAEIGEFIKYGEWPAFDSKEWDKYLHKVSDWQAYKPKAKNVNLLSNDISFPNAISDPKEAGFHPKLMLYKGGKYELPETMTRYPATKVGGGNYKEGANFLADEEWVAGKYGSKVHEFVAAPKRAFEVEWPKVNGGLLGYHGASMKKLLRAAQHRKADMVIIHNMDDIGGAGQTQYAVLDTSILRSPEAKFDPKAKDLAMPMAGIAGGVIFLKGPNKKEEDGAREFRRGGAVEQKVNGSKLERALRTAKKYASGGPLDMMADKSDTSKFMPFSRGLLGAPIPGRTDKLPIKVKPGSYVIPADILSSTALGQGNTLAGSKVLDIGFAKHRGPRTGMFKGMGRTAMRNPAARMKSPTPKFARQRMGFADGGVPDDGIPIIAAGGEYIVEPEVVQSIGGGDVNRGHDILDDFVKKVRADNIKTLKKLPGPKRD